MSWPRKLVALIRSIIKLEQALIHTHIPGQIISYNATTNLASIQPCVNIIRTTDPDNMGGLEQAVLEDVPVKHQGSGKIVLTCAPQVGSYGILHISERALDDWLVKGGKNNPSNARRFDLSDAFFDPGIYPLIVDGNNGLLVPPVNTDRIEMRTRLGTGYVAVVDDGNIEIDGLVTVKIGGSAASEPAMHGTKFITKYNAHVHSTAFGPSGIPAVPWLSTDNSLKVKIG